MTEAEIAAIAERAAKQAVDETLRRLNLNDDESGQDVHDLRELLSSWRSAKRTMWTTVVRSITLFALGMMALGVVMQVRKNLGE